MSTALPETNKLTPAIREQLERVLAEAYDQQGLLQFAARYLDFAEVKFVQEIDFHTAASNIAFKMVTLADQHGVVDRLVLGLRADRPQRDEPKDLVAALGLPDPLETKSVITPVPIESAGKRTLVLQPPTEPNSLPAARAQLIRTQLIEPACRDASLTPVFKSPDPENLMKPLVSPLQSEPLAIIDLGTSPWDDDLLIDIGFRLAADRKMVILVDSPLDREKLPKNLRHLIDGCFLEVDANRPARSQVALIAKLKAASASKSLFWSSQYAYVDYRVNWSDANECTYVDANEAAARLSGYDRREDMVGKTLGEVATRFFPYMPDAHRKAFENDQWLLELELRAAQDDHAVKARVRYPLWFNDHKFDEFKNKAFLPVLVQHKKEANNPNVMVMRTTYIDISDWCQEGLENLPDTTILEIPEMYRLRPRRIYHVMLPCDATQVPYMKLLASVLDKVDCRCWIPPEGAENMDAENFVQQLAQSHILAIPLGIARPGKWLEKTRIRAAVLEHCGGGGPHVLLVPPEFYGDDGAWKDASLSWNDPVSKKIWDILHGNSLYLHLPPEAELQQSLGQPPKGLSDRVLRLVVDVLNR